jgi:hypothetical protein
VKGVALLAVALAAAGLVADVAPAAAADECKGLQVCIPVAGPWVVIPPAAGAARASWRLVCPEGVVGGVDALASERAVAAASGCSAAVTASASTCAPPRPPRSSRPCTSWRPGAAAGCS